MLNSSRNTEVVVQNKVVFVFLVVHSVLFSVVTDCSELERNKLRVLEGLVFQGLESLLSLKLKRNSISQLMDGTFWGLGKILSL